MDARCSRFPDVTFSHCLFPPHANVPVIRVGGRLLEKLQGRRDRMGAVQLRAEHTSLQRCTPRVQLGIQEHSPKSCTCKSSVTKDEKVRGGGGRWRRWKVSTGQQRSAAYTTSKGPPLVYDFSESGRSVEIRIQIKNFQYNCSALSNFYTGRRH